jgi:hypothetical protein
MKEAQTIKKQRPAALIITPRRQNLLKEEIPFSYSVKKRGN